MLPPDTAFRIDTRMTADFDINDVRPMGSPALTWYLEVAVGWLPDKQVKHYPTGMVNTVLFGPSTCYARDSIGGECSVPTLTT